MVKHTQTIRQQIGNKLFECVWPFFELVLKGLKILQSDWAWAFFQIWDLSKHTAININFHYRLNCEKINLIFLYIQKALGLAYFAPFWGQKYYFQQIWLCHAQHHMGLWHHAKFQKKLNSQFQENFQTEGRTDLVHR